MVYEIIPIYLDINNPQQIPKQPGALFLSAQFTSKVDST